MSTVTATQVQRPTVRYVKPSLLVPGGAQPAAGQPAGTPAAPKPSSAPSPTPQAQPARSGAAQAAAGPSLLGRLMGLVPLAAGLTQAAVGFMITNGTISLAAVPLLGSVPGWIVGTLVGATAVGSIMQGVKAVLGR